MCGRFSFATSKEKLQQQFPEMESVGGTLRTNFNIAPTQHAYVVTNDSPHRLQYITWGLIPHWSNDGQNNGKLINARMEGIVTKPSFRLPIRKRRCWVLADSFYEWRTEGSRKIPYRILLKNGALLIMAGIWDVWYKKDYAIKSFSIITAPPNAEMQTLHDRIPLVLHTKAAQQRWLEDLDLDEVLGMLHTPPDGLFQIYRVSEKLNSVVHNSPDLHEPLPEPPTLF